MHVLLNCLDLNLLAVRMIVRVYGCLFLFLSARLPRLGQSNEVFDADLDVATS